MPSHVPAILWMAGSLLLAGATGGAAAGEDPLAAELWRRRVLLVSASSAADARVVEQRRIFAALGREARDRDLVLVEALGDAPRARALRQKFDLQATDFRVLLIGKDGGEKLSSATPLGDGQLFPVIDAMPMRQEEMRRRP
jgi:hypothetical protein